MVAIHQLLVGRGRSLDVVVSPCLPLPSSPFASWPPFFGLPLVGCGGRSVVGLLELLVLAGWFLLWGCSGGWLGSLHLVVAVFGERECGKVAVSIGVLFGAWLWLWLAVGFAPTYALPHLPLPYLLPSL